MFTYKAYNKPTKALIVGIHVILESLTAKNVLGATLRDAIEMAALTNPAIQSSWSAFEAATEGVRAARGGYYPKVDVVLERGRETTEDPQRIEQSFSTENYNITVTQMLFDGFATKNEVSQQRYFRLARYYEFRQASETIALETAQAYLDVLRFRAFVSLAKENYFQHLRYFSDIEERVTSGIGRGVDLQQASARLALSESNVLTETTNLHDVSARYHRLVGTLPPEEMKAPNLRTTIIPTHRKAALHRAFNANPELNAAIENIRVTRADMKGRNAPMMPRLDLRLYKQIDENDRNTIGRYDEKGIELVMTYNLYNGGSDSARKRQSRSLLYEATYTRDRVCRDIRQSVSIAFNDIQSTEKLIGYLEKNEKAISQARQAYKNQFDIGQRTLLDLLDTENEYFEVKRTLTRAKYDHLLAELRTLSGMGMLLYAMKVEGLDKDLLDDLDLSREDTLSAKCPAEAPLMGKVDFDVAKIIGPPKVNTLRLSNREVMQLDLKFENSSSTLSDTNETEIVRTAAFLCDNPGIESIVEGHTDSLGAASYNLSLSQSRADSVRIALTQACPDADGRLSAIGFGETRPIASNDSPSGRAVNRRVELILEKGD